MPREAILHQPPSSEPLVLEGEALIAAAARVLRVDRTQVATARLRKLSFDARPRERRWRLSVDVWMRGEAVPAAVPTTPPTYARPRDDAARVVIVGSGPSGLYCALDLLAAGCHVLVLERGRDVQARRRDIANLQRGQPADSDSNYCFGEGGAGTYSDGKLYTRSGSKDEIRGVLEMFVAHGARAEILASWRPHIGSNRLPEVVKAMRETIERSGGRVEFETRAECIETAAGADGLRVVAVHVRRLVGGALERHACDALVLATGHSANDAHAMARAAGATLAAKGFAMGVRVEHPQPWLDERQYGGLREHCELPASFYELRHQHAERGVYSFCMCPGGFVVPTQTAADAVVVNGMSLSRRDSPYANSGLVVQIEPEDWCVDSDRAWGWSELLERACAGDARLREALRPGAPPRVPADDPLYGTRLQRALEICAARAGGGANRAPVQRADAFVASIDANLAGELPAALPTSYQPGLQPSALASWMPRGLVERLAAGLRAFEQQLPGFAGPYGQLIGVESRTSSPVRVLRHEQTLEAIGLHGLYPCGEGAGYAGGIVSAALDGRRVAAAVARKLAAHGAAPLGEAGS